MSIKSQKSLNEECSEIFEKSYSVRSLSEESLSVDDEESLSRELLNKLSPAAISQLRRRFKRGGQKTKTNDINRKVEEAMVAAARQEGVEFEASAAHPTDSLWLDEDGFVAAIDEIFGEHRYSTHARQLCLALDPLRTGRVHWGALRASLLPAPRAPRSPALCEKPARLPHCQRECIVKLVSVQVEDTFCYVGVTRGGRAGVYSGDLQLLNTYEVFQQRAAAQRRVKNCWVTDAVYMSDAGYVAYATSERCVRVFAAPGHAHAHKQLHCITGLPDLPTCLSYSPSSSSSPSSLLAAGTVRGEVCALRCSRPRAALLQHEPDTLAYCSWTDLCSGAQRSYCSARVLPSHSRTVRRVACERDGRRFVSCSQDASVSLRLRHSCPHLDDYVVKIQRGASCFHVVWSLQLVATGGADGALRLWQLAPLAPLARLARPAAAPLVDVAIIAHMNIVVAFHNNCTVNIWDLHEECLLQSIKIKFPFLGAPGRKLEFGAYCIHPGPPREKERTEDKPEQSPSRRGSQVYRGSTGGLLLEDNEEASDGTPGDVKSDPEYIRFNVSELLITCCDHVCRVTLAGPRAARPAAPRPPGAALRPRRPSCWDLHDDLDSDDVRGAVSSDHRDVEPKDISRLLEGAGLQGLLEKDFVLMQGLKNDLNKKLHLMRADIDATSWAVTSGAPHLALRPQSLARVPAPRDRLSDYINQLSLEFPPPSAAATPSASSSSTPAQSRTTKS